MNNQDIIFKESTLETIDYALINWVKKLNLHVKSASGWEQVPVLWEKSEKSFQFKHNQQIRDEKGNLIYPIMFVKRNSVKKDVEKQMHIGNIPNVNDYKGGSLTIAKKINQDKTANFENARSKYWTGFKNSKIAPKKTVYKIYTVPMPTYLEVSYTLRIISEYMEHMNQLLSPFLSTGGNINYHLIDSEQGHKYETFIDAQYEIQNEDRDGEVIYFSDISFRVMGYIIGAGPNQSQPKITVRENAVDIKLLQEKIIKNY